MNYGFDDLEGGFDELSLGGAKGKKKASGAKKTGKKKAGKPRSRSGSRTRLGSSSHSGGARKTKKTVDEKIYTSMDQSTVVNAKSATDAAKKFASKALRKKGSREGKVTVRFRCLSPGKTQNYEYVYDIEKKKVRSTSKIGKKTIAGKDGMVSKFTKVVKVDKIRPNK